MKIKWTKKNNLSMISSVISRRITYPQPKQCTYCSSKGMSYYTNLITFTLTTSSQQRRKKSTRTCCTTYKCKLSDHIWPTLSITYHIIYFSMLWIPKTRNYTQSTLLQNWHKGVHTDLSKLWELSTKQKNCKTNHNYMHTYHFGFA